VYSKKYRHIFINRFKLWLRGYIIVKKFLTKEEIQQIRESSQSIDWLTAGNEVKQGSFINVKDGFKSFDENKIFSEQMTRRSHRILRELTGYRLKDCNVRTIQLRMHSPKWHIDSQTLDYLNPYITRCNRFKVYKCGVYLQDSASGSGGLEVRTPYLGGGIKNFIFWGADANSISKKKKSNIWAKALRCLGFISDSVQILTLKPNISPGDILIFDGGLRHRASQPRNSASVEKDELTGYYIDRNDAEGKIMLQWEFTLDNVLGDAYIKFLNSIKFPKH